jgi:hypothetical protein
MDIWGCPSTSARASEDSDILPLANATVPRETLGNVTGEEGLQFVGINYDT